MGYLSRLRNLRHRPARSLAGYQPRIDVLEGRCLPSTVTNLNDAGPGSLRDAIASTPPGGTVDFDAALAGTIDLTTGDLAITNDLTITGPGADALTVSGNHASRVFDIAAGFTVDISGLTVGDGATNADGGGILNSGILTVTNCTVSGNSAADGGGIDNHFGTLMVTNTTLSSNSAQYWGGGIYNVQGTVTVADSTLTGNSANSDGGGILNDSPGGMLTVTSSTLSDNSANFGGGIYNSGTLTVTNSSLSGNSAVLGTGGGIYNGNPGTVTITNSTLSGNSAFGGGAILNEGGGTLTITNSTLSGNFAIGARPGAEAGGGAISNIGTLTVTNSTLSGNSAGGFGGGAIFSNALTFSAVTITNSTLSGNSATGADASGAGIRSWGSAAMYLRNTIIAGNTGPTGPDLAGDFGSQGYNLIGDGSGGTGFDPSDLVGTPDNPIDPMIGPLQDNGGPTQTMALLPGSLALNAGDLAQLGVADQRGVVRSGGVNIGAYQASASAFALTAPDTVTAGTPFDVTVTAVDPFGQVAVGYTGTVTFSTTDPDPGTVLPDSYPFTAADQGTHTFSSAFVLLTSGPQTLTADDADGGFCASAVIAVADGPPAPAPRGAAGGVDAFFAALAEGDAHRLPATLNHVSCFGRYTHVSPAVLR
jgi:hypothetical protein